MADSSSCRSAAVIAALREGFNGLAGQVGGREREGERQRGRGRGRPIRKFHKSIWPTSNPHITLIKSINAYRTFI